MRFPLLLSLSALFAVGYSSEAESEINDIPDDALSNVYDNMSLKHTTAMRAVSKRFNEVHDSYIEHRVARMTPRQHTLAFREAVRDNQIIMVKSLLRENRVDAAENNNFAIYLAANKGHSTLFRLILEKMNVQNLVAELNGNLTTKSLFQQVIEANQTEILEALLDHQKIRASLQPQQWESMVLYSAKDGSYDIFEAVMNRLANPETTCSNPAVTQLPKGPEALKKAKYLREIVQCPIETFAALLSVTSHSGYLDLFEYLWSFLPEEHTLLYSRFYWERALGSFKLDICIFLYSIPQVREAEGQTFLARMKYYADRNPKLLEALLDHGDVDISVDMALIKASKYLRDGEIEVATKLEEYADRLIQMQIEEEDEDMLEDDLN